MIIQILGIELIDPSKTLLADLIVGPLAHPAESKIARSWSTEPQQSGFHASIVLYNDCRGVLPDGHIPRHKDFSVGPFESGTLLRLLLKPNFTFRARCILHLHIPKKKIFIRNHLIIPSWIPRTTIRNRAVSWNEVTNVPLLVGASNSHTSFCPHPTGSARIIPLS